MSTSVVVNTFGKSFAKTFCGDRMSLGVNNMSGEQSFADFVRERIGEKSHRDVALI